MALALRGHGASGLLEKHESVTDEATCCNNWSSRYLKVSLVRYIRSLMRRPVRPVGPATDQFDLLDQLDLLD
jgi:hypothetical protein